MATEIRKNVPAIAKTIDAVLDTAPATPLVRPSAKLRPSWIGPVRPKSPGLGAMKQHVSVEYSSPGLQPPVYVFTNLSEPQWEPVEMQLEKKADGGSKFTKSFEVEEGEYQYKFRLGPGDWWACDESKAMVDDGSGNKNNLVAVKPEPVKPQTPMPEQPKQDNKGLTPVASQPPPTPLPLPNPQPPTIGTAQSHVTSALTPLKQNVESYIAPVIAKLKPDEPKATPTISTPEPHQASLPTKHENISAPVGAQSQQTPGHEPSDPLFQHSDDEDDDVHTPPLLRHESLRPSSAEQVHAPLFRHESISMGNNRHDLESITKAPANFTQRAVGGPQIPQGPTPHAPAPEPFPTDLAGVLDKIRRTVTSLPPDDSSDHSLSSPLSQAVSGSSTNSLESVDEEAEEELERIREVGEDQYEHEEDDGEEMDPLMEGDAPITPPLTDEEPEDDDFEPKINNPDLLVVKAMIIEGMERPKNLANRLADMVGGEGIAL